jgi:solute carrier family 45 protein 1/2/4
VTALVGISWAATLWVPFALLGEIINGRDVAKATQLEYQIVGIEDPSEDMLLSQPTNQLEAGVILGIHNVYIVMPQFISTIISSAVFALMGWLLPEYGQLDAFVTVLVICGMAPLFAGVLAYRLPVADLKEH